MTTLVLFVASSPNRWITSFCVVLIVENSDSSCSVRLAGSSSRLASGCQRNFARASTLSSSLLSGRYGSNAMAVSSVAVEVKYEGSQWIRADFSRLSVLFQ
jgi:hypothetical protein